jgi:predicted amidophosphoribosyltransferase
MPKLEMFKAADQTAFPLVPTPVCDYCSTPLGDSFGDWRICAKCNRRFRELSNINPGVFLYSPYSFTRAVAAGLYITDNPDKGSAGRLITRLKADGGYCDALAEAIVHVLRTRCPDVKWDVIVPVPPSPEKSFSPPRLLAAKVGEMTRTHLASVLELDSTYESGLRLTERLKFDNMKGKVRIAGNEKVAGKTVLLVDDIMTTQGAAHWCSDSLLKAGAAEVNVAVAGRSVDMRHLDFIGYAGPY